MRPTKRHTPVKPIKIAQSLRAPNATRGRRTLASARCKAYPTRLTSPSSRSNARIGAVRLTHCETLQIMSAKLASLTSSAHRTRLASVSSPDDHGDVAQCQLRRSIQPSPIFTSRSPAIAGPITRAPCKHRGVQSDGVHQVLASYHVDQKRLSSREYRTRSPPPAARPVRRMCQHRDLCGSGSAIARMKRQRSSTPPGWR